MSSIQQRIIAVFFAVLAVALLTAPVYAQVDTGTILGTVRDRSDAVVPNATITLTNTGTSVSFTTETDDAGRYIFPAIKIGTYQVAVEAPGFKKAVRSGIQLNIQQQAEINVTLETGEITQTLEVAAEAPLLQTQESSVGQAIGADKINNLPIFNRDWTNLARLSTGVNIPQPGARASNQFAANGTRPAQNNYMLDGIDNNTASVDFLNGRADIVRPPVDAIGEVKVQTNGFSAEYGRAGGAVLNASFKSGTNNFHGSAWEFIRNDIFDANRFDNNWRGTQKAPFRQNQFGATFGGPIWKNKTFFFADYEGFRLRQNRVIVATIPTALERASGYTDFSDLIPRLGNRVRGTDLLGRRILQGTIFDPATTRRVTRGQVDPVTGLVATGNGFVRDPFPGNIIPAGRLNQNAIRLMNLYPAENFIQPGTPGGNYVGNRKLTDDRNQFDVRIDHNFSDTDHIFGRYSFANFDIFRPGPFEGVADGGGFGDGVETVRIHGLAVSHTHAFSTSLLNEARLGLSREHTLRNPPFGDDTSDIPSQFGIRGVPQAKGNGGLPPLNIGGLSRLGAVTWLFSDRFSNTTQLTDNLTKSYKSHTFKGGFEFQYTDFPWAAPPFARGNFNWGGGFTSAPALGDGNTGRAQFLLNPVAATVPGGVDNVGGLDLLQASPFGGVNNNRQYYGAYFQDDWKVSPRLTLNLGLRWEHFSLTGEANSAQANFIPDPTNSRYIIPAKRRDNPRLSQAFVDALARSGIALVYTDEFGSGLGLAQKKNFAPRFGFAYRVTQKLVARGGYGIFYGAFENRGGFPNLGYNYPFQFDFTFRAPNDVAPLVYPDGSQGTLERGLLGVPLDASRVNPGGLNLRGIEFKYKTPYTQGFHMILQYELTSSNSFEIGYVGSQARHIETFVGTNHLPVLLPPGQGLNPQNFVPYPIFARASSYAATTGNSSYHSLQSKFIRRFSKGLDLLASYTWSKTLTNAGDLLSGGAVQGFRAPGIYSIRKEMALAAFHVKHALVVSGSYDLPFGKGKSFLTDLPRFADAILGGWSTNWIYAYYSGQPQGIACTIATNEGGGCASVRVPGVSLYTDQRDSSGFQVLYNAAAFTNPPRATTIGQTDLSPLGGDRTPVTGPPLWQLDFSLFKNFRITERFRLEFRAEAFNLTNSVSFNFPNSNFQSTTFGRLESQRNSPRQMQFALKLYY